MKKARKTGGTKVSKTRTPGVVEDRVTRYPSFEKRDHPLPKVREKTINVWDTVKPVSHSGPKSGEKSALHAGRLGLELMLETRPWSPRTSNRVEWNPV